MGEPITWRTVIGPSLADAARPLNDAVTTLGGASDILDKAIQRQQTVNQGFADRARNAQVQAYLDTVAAAKTPADVTALQQSGHLDALRAQIDPRDLALIRGADEARRTSLQQQTTATDQFNDQQAVQTHQAAIQDVLATAALGTPEAKAAAHAKLAAITDNLPNRGELASAIEKGYEGVQGFKTADALRQKQADLATAQAVNMPAQIGVEQERNRIAARGNDIQLLGTFSGAGGGGVGGAAGGAGTTAGADASAGTLESAINAQYKEDPQRARTMLRIAAQAIDGADPKTADMLRQLPPDVQLRVLQAHSGDTGTGNWNPLDSNPLKFGLGNSVADNVRADLIKEAGLESVKRTVRINQASQQLGIERAIQKEQSRQRLSDSLLSGALGTPGAAPVSGGVSAAVPGAAPAPAPASDAPSSQEMLTLATRFKGDAAKTVAAVSTSPEAVETAVAKYGDAWLSHMDKETQDYVAEETKGHPAVIKGYENLAAAPAPASAPTAPPAAVPSNVSKLEQLAQTEVALHDRGEIKDLSPEVQKYLDEQTARDRQALIASARAAGSGTAKLGAAAADLFTLPARAGMGVVNNGIRGLNAMGLPVPYIPDSNGIISSITPYSDMLARRAGATGQTTDLKALRAKLLEDVKKR